MRLNPRMMPKVNVSHAQKGHGFDRLDDKYAALEMQPLKITAHMGTAYVPSEGNRVHLDSLLSWAVLESHPVSPHFAANAIVVPLPLLCLWQSPQGLPLWAASMLAPTQNSISDKQYWHKRYPSDHAELGKTMRADTSAGRWKEYRVPLSTVRCETVQALAIGHLETVQALLEKVLFIGKKPTQGCGRVLYWSVEALPQSLEHTTAQILSLRPVPTAYLESRGADKIEGTRRAWTPPYWFAPWHGDAVMR